MPRLLVEKGPDRGKSLTIAVGQQVVAGRDKAATLQLSDNMASRRHFLIASKGSVFGLKDLDSANGTLVNGKQASGAHRLKYGDSIQVGETLISWLSDEQAEQGGLIGQQIGGYRVEERLGRGAMGTVYKATQLSLGRTIALKVLAQDLVKDQTFCEMFVKEARAAGGLNHPNIVQVYDVGDEAGQYFFSMEYAERGSVLEELSQTKSISMPRAVRIIKDSCSALDYAERKGLVHRDIKPDNLMVMEDSTVKLGDLGLAMSAQELQAEQDGVFGTPHYIAPEQAMGKPIDHRADIYALGATFYRMLTGRTLFQGATVKEILKKQVREAHPPITTHMPDCPQAIVRIIDRMLAKNPAERYQHASEILTDLTNWEDLAARKGGVDSAAFAASPGGLTPEESQMIRGAGANQKIMIAAVVALVAVLAAAGSIYFFVFGDSGNNTIADTNNAGGNKANIRPAGNNTPDELPKDVKAANEKLNEAVLRAEIRMEQDDPVTVQSYEDAIAYLVAALNDYPKASQDKKDRAAGYQKELEAELEEFEKGEIAAQTAWDETWRAVGSQIKEFKYTAAGELVKNFIRDYRDSQNPGVQDIVKGAEQYLADDFGTAVQDHYFGTEQVWKRERTNANDLQPEEKLETVTNLYNEVVAAKESCDDAAYIRRFEEYASTLEGDIVKLKSEAQLAERNKVNKALEAASASLEKVMQQIRGDIARGNFTTTQQRLESWQLSDPAFLKYGDHERLAPIREELARRLDQTMLIHESLYYLSTKKILPRLLETNTLLGDHPWPEYVADALGGEKVYLMLTVKPKLDSDQWSLERNILGGDDLPTMNASDFDSREMRLAVAGAISHLIQHHPGALQALMAKAHNDVPALVGIFAWMLELGADEAAFPLIEFAWQNIGTSDPARDTVREYYAWGLLGKANAHAARGEKLKARAAIAQLQRNFADTRANKGRK